MYYNRKLLCALRFYITAGERNGICQVAVKKTICPLEILKLFGDDVTKCGSHCGVRHMLLCHSTYEQIDVLYRFVHALQAIDDLKKECPVKSFVRRNFPI